MHQPTFLRLGRCIWRAWQLANGNPSMRSHSCPGQSRYLSHGWLPRIGKRFMQAGRPLLPVHFSIAQGWLLLGSHVRVIIEDGAGVLVADAVPSSSTIRLIPVPTMADVAKRARIAYTDW